MVFEIKPFPEWSWSQTRNQMFNECIRKYYFHYYVSHNGWTKTADKKSKSAYELKNLANLYLIFGEGLHYIIESLLKNWQQIKTLPDSAEVVSKLREFLNQAFKDSKKIVEWKRSPKKLKMLQEIYYGEHLPDDKVKKIKERIHLCSDNIFKNNSLKEMLYSQDIQIKEIEVLRDFKINDQKVYVKLDALYQNGDGKWIIVDWKTGIEYEKNEDQLLLYAIFLHEYYKIAYEDIEIRLEYLLTGECVKILVDISKVIEVKQEIINSMEDMKSYLENQEENKPLPKLFFTASPSKYKCQECKFREICDEHY